MDLYPSFISKRHNDVVTFCVHHIVCVSLPQVRYLLPEGVAAKTNAAAIGNFLRICCVHKLIVAAEHHRNVSIVQNANNACHRWDTDTSLWSSILHPTAAYFGKPSIFELNMHYSTSGT